MSPGLEVPIRESASSLVGWRPCWLLLAARAMTVLGKPSEGVTCVRDAQDGADVVSREPGFSISRDRPEAAVAENIFADEGAAGIDLPRCDVA